MSNLDPTHTIPLLVAGALQSGLAFVFLPRANGFALMVTEPAEPFTDAEIEHYAQASAIADVDMAALSTLELSYQLGIATKRLAGHLVSEGLGQGDDDLTPAEQAAVDELSRTTPFGAEVIRQAVLAARDFDVSAQAILNALAAQGSDGETTLQRTVNGERVYETHPSREAAHAAADKYLGHDCDAHIQSRWRESLRPMLTEPLDLTRVDITEGTGAND